MEGTGKVVLLLLLLSAVVTANTVYIVGDIMEPNETETTLAHGPGRGECQIADPSCPKPDDCLKIMKMGYKNNGVYNVYVGPFDEPVKVYCDQETDGGGWLVFQRRRDGFENFYRGWNDYANGFGSLYGEFWLGNHVLNLITQQKAYKLRVDLEDFTGDTAVAEYTTFSVGAAYLKYPLTVGGYSGTAGDSMRHHNGMKFSTHDQDNDNASESCAGTYGGAWWYFFCHKSNLNGKYLGGSHTSYANGVNWNYWKGYHYSLKTTEMKIRPTYA